MSLDKPTESAERLLQERFRKLGLFPEAFSSIQYRGTRTYNPPTDFSGLLRSLEQQLDNNTTRSPRSASVIYKALQVIIRKCLKKCGSYIDASFCDMMYLEHTCVFVL